jgi:hypothetical protein
MHLKDATITERCISAVKRFEDWKGLWQTKLFKYFPPWLISFLEALQTPVIMATLLALLFRSNSFTTSIFVTFTDNGYSTTNAPLGVVIEVMKNVSG